MARSTHSSYLTCLPLCCEWIHNLYMIFCLAVPVVMLYRHSQLLWCTFEEHISSFNSSTKDSKCAVLSDDIPFTALLCRLIAFQPRPQVQRECFYVEAVLPNLIKNRRGSFCPDTKGTRRPRFNGFQYRLLYHSQSFRPRINALSAPSS